MPTVLTEDERRRARELAQKILALVEIVPQREGAELVRISTPAICHAMGQPASAPLEQVQRFVYEVLEHLRPHGLDTACGCGYLALVVGPGGVRERAWRASRELCSFEPDDIDEYLRASSVLSREHKPSGRTRGGLGAAEEHKPSGRTRGGLGAAEGAKRRPEPPSKNGNGG